MSDFQFQDENSIRAVFSMEVGREMNDHSMLYNKSLPNQHPISAITGLTEALAEGSSNLQTEIDRAEAAEQALDDKIEAETTRAEGVESGLNTAISNETSARIQADTTLQNNITAEENRAKGIENGLRSDITAETTARQNADNNLQSQIDAISASSDVTDIVGTYAELQAYDTSTLTNDDIIKVLQDESQGGATTYYRWVVSGSSGAFVLIGSEGPYYTKAEADELLDEKQDEITDTNKLASDLVNDTNQTNKFVTASEKSQITTNANNIVDLQNSKASTSLDNLSADGQMIIDSQNGTISNCVLDIPQNIHLTLENNILTLKSGSVLTRQGSTYETYTTTEDYTRDLSSLSNGKYYIFSAQGSGVIQTPKNITKIGSGSSLPANNTDYSVFYLTTDKSFYLWGSNNSWENWTVAYPLCIIEVSSGVASIAKDSNGNDMIFNGFGFVGHHIFIYPNINAYMPAELNPDGSLASTKIGTNALRIIEALSGYGVDSLKRWISLQSNHTISNWSAYKEVNHDSEADYTIANVRYYARDINLIKMYRSGSVSAVDGVPLVEYYYDGSNITSFTPRQCVRTATVEMVDKVQAKVDTNTTAIAGKQDTLVSGTNIKTINSTTVLGSGNFALADQSLSNLDSNGQMIVDSQNGTISNCILDIPQNIKLTLENNVLTLKSGSVLTIPGSVYTTVTTTQDLTETFNSNGTHLVCGKRNGTQIYFREFQNCVSGAGATTNGGFAYDTTTNEIWYCLSDGTKAQLCTYPICIIKVENGVASFAKDSNGNDMIFNGAGFIGHHAFVYPNVKGLRAFGFYEDKTLKSQAQKTTALQLYELPNNRSVTYLYLGAANDLVMGSTVAMGYPKYVAKENWCYCNTSSISSFLPIVSFATDSNRIVTDFTIRQPYQGARNLLTDDIDEQVKQNTTDISTKQADLTTVSGYDATTTQVLKNINGVLTWVTEGE